MSEQPTGHDSVSEELRRLAENLKNTIGTFWESDERKNFTQEIEQGVSEVGKAIENLANELTEGETGQKIKNDVQDLQNRYKSGELEKKIRDDAIATLQNVNDELLKFSDRWKSKPQRGEQNTPSGETPE